MSNNSSKKPANAAPLFEIELDDGTTMPVYSVDFDFTDEDDMEEVEEEG